MIFTHNLLDLHSLKRDIRPLLVIIEAIVTLFKKNVRYLEV